MNRLWILFLFLPFTDSEQTISLINPESTPLQNPSSDSSLVNQWRTRWPTLQEAWHNFKQSCHGHCFNTQEFIEVYWKITHTLQMMMANYMNDVPMERMTPRIAIGGFDQQCRVLNQTKACIDNCSQTTSDDVLLHKAQAESLIGLTLRFCTGSIKAHQSCVFAVWSQASPTCNRKCIGYKQDAMREVHKYHDLFERYYDRRENYDHLLRDTIAKVGNYSCRFLNCRQNCRKNDIIERCGQAGYEGTKDMLRLVGDVLQKIRDDIPSITPRGRDAVPEMPEECYPEKLAEENPVE